MRSEGNNLLRRNIPAVAPRRPEPERKNIPPGDIIPMRSEGNIVQANAQNENVSKRWGIVRASCLLIGILIEARKKNNAMTTIASFLRNIGSLRAAMSKLKKDFIK